MMYGNILVVTDSHLGFRQDEAPSHTVGHAWAQPAWEDGQTQLFLRLRDLCVEHNIGVAIHCGDLTHWSDRIHIRRAIAQLKTLGVPCVLSFGNHDRLEEDAVGIWMEELDNEPWLIWSERGMFSTPKFDIIPVDNDWLDACGTYRPWWQQVKGGAPIPGISDKELARVSELLSRKPSRPVILVVHCPTWLLPPHDMLSRLGERGLEHIACYNARMAGLIHRFPNIRLVLSGHIHAAKSMQFGAVQLSTAALFEAPFQIRRLTIDDTWIRVTTQNLWQAGDPVAPLPTRAHLLGELRDQEVRVKLVL